MRYKTIKARILADLSDLTKPYKLPSRPVLCRQYGVSRTTLDRAIAELTKEGILKSKKGSGTYYISDPTHATEASELVIGVLFPNNTNIVYSDILSSFEPAMQSIGASILSIHTDNNIDKFEDGIRHCLKVGVHGIIFIPTPSSNLLKLGRALHLIQKSNIPYVSCNRLISDLKGPHVSSDNYFGGYMATKHLYKQGYRRIAFIAGWKYITSQLRCNGYVAALKDLGLPLNYERIFMHATRDNELRGFNEIKQMLQDKDPIDAVICNHDSIAVAAYMAVTESGKKISDDIGIIGYNNTDYCDFSNPPLTSIDFGGKKVGTLAANLLTDMLKGKKVEAEKPYIVAPEIIVRESCLGPIGEEIL